MDDIDDASQFYSALVSDPMNCSQSKRRQLP